jgi:hypothetical protein
MTINDSGNSSTQPFASRSWFRLSPGTSPVTKSAEPAARLSATGALRSDDSGHRTPPSGLAATPGSAGRGLSDRDTPIIRGEVDRKLAPLSSGEAMTVVDPSIRFAAGWTVPRSPTSSWAWRAGLFFIQEQWQ